MKNFTNLISLVITSLLYYVLFSFINWEFELSEWSPFSRFIYVVLLIYTIYKTQIENEN